MLAATGRRGILRRALKNAGMLLSGKASAGVMQLATFALAARGLGLNEFGLFSMLLAQVQLLTGIAAFQSNQAIVRYGVGHIEAGNTRAFQALIKAGTLLDVGAATLAMLATLALAPVIGEQLGWDARLVGAAQLIAPLAFATAIATPKGLLRLFDRFDLLTKHSMVTPGARLIGVAACYAAGAPLVAYLAVWLAAGLLGAVVAVWLAWRELAQRDLLRGMDASLAGLTRANEGIWRFSIVANVHSSLALIPNHLSTFLVGALLTPAAAGLFKVARELGTAFAKPVELLNQSVYPDVARLVVAREWRRLSRTVIHAGLVAAGASGLVTLLILAAGETLIAAVFGASYAAAQPVLLLIAVATTISVLAFAVDPALYALGRPGYALTTAFVANLAFAGLLVWRLPADGIQGAGWAYLAAALITLGLSTAWFARARLRAMAA